MTTMPGTFWCEHCRHRFDVDHYDDLVVPEDDDSPCTGGGHKAGVEYGWFGRLLAVEQAAKELATAVAPLLDQKVPAPHSIVASINVSRLLKPEEDAKYWALFKAHAQLSELLGETRDA